MQQTQWGRILVCSALMVIAIAHIAQGQTCVSPSPPLLTVTIGETTSCRIDIQQVTNLQASHILLEFDSTLVRQDSVSRGSLYPAPPGGFFSTTPAGGSSFGRVAVDQALLGGPTLSGSGTLCTVHFTALGTGVTHLHLTVYLRDPSNTPIALSAVTYRDVNVVRGWNLLAIPVIPVDGQTSVLFPDAISTAYLYLNGYQTTQTLSSGPGYWLKFAGTGDYPILGSTPMARDITVAEGWNMIGGLDRNTPTDLITSTPPGIVTSNYFKYTHGYTTAMQLTEGTGYWVKVSQAGILHIPDGIPKAATAEPETSARDLCLSFRDGEGSQCVITLCGSGGRAMLEEYPPPPPAEIFDVRFNSEEPGPSTGKNLRAIRIQAAHYPISVVATNLNGRSLLLKDPLGGVLVNEELHEGIPITLAEHLDRYLLVEEDHNGENPTHVVLWQNYPNPFNPTTQISYSVEGGTAGTRDEVSLRVYDLLGREVATLVHGAQAPGSYTVVFNGEGMSSGVYLYRLSAGTSVIEKAMLLLR